MHKELLQSKIPIKELVLKYIKYNPNTGLSYLDSRLINISEDYFVVFTLESTRIKLKYDNLIWILVHNTKPASKQKVFHKDLDQNNFKLNNLVLISNKTYFKIKEYLYNLSGGLKMYPRPNDAYSTVLEYKFNGRKCKEVLGDIGLARNKMLKLQLRMLKYIGHYVITD